MALLGSINNVFGCFVACLAIQPCSTSKRFTHTRRRWHLWRRAHNAKYAIVNWLIYLCVSIEASNLLDITKFNMYMTHAPMDFRVRNDDDDSTHNSETQWRNMNERKIETKQSTPIARHFLPVEAKCNGNLICVSIFISNVFCRRAKRLKDLLLFFSSFISLRLF